MNYCVEPRTRIGRPAKRWDNQIESFAHQIFHSSWFQAANYETWSSHEKTFVQWCLERWCLAVVVFPCPSRTVALTRTGIALRCDDLLRVFNLLVVERLCWGKMETGSAIQRPNEVSFRFFLLVWTMLSRSSQMCAQNLFFGVVGPDVVIMNICLTLCVGIN